MGGLGVLLLLQRQERGALIGLDLLGVPHHEDNGDQRGHNGEKEAQTNDDGLINLDALGGKGIDGGTDGERVDRGTQAAASRAEQDGSGADQRVEAGSHHGGGKQGVERDRLFTHAVGGSAEGEQAHEHRNNPNLTALELLNEHGDAVVQRAGLGHHAEEAAEDHYEEADGQRIGEALDRCREEVAERSGGHGIRRTGNNYGDDGDDCQ